MNATLQRDNPLQLHPAGGGEVKKNTGSASSDVLLALVSAEGCAVADQPRGQPTAPGPAGHDQRPAIAYELAPLLVIAQRDETICELRKDLDRAEKKIVVLQQALREAYRIREDND